MSRVANPAAWSCRATERLRGLCRLLPLPWANNTIPLAPSGTSRSPSRVTGPASTRTCRSIALAVFCIAAPLCILIIGHVVRTSRVGSEK